MSRKDTITADCTSEVSKNDNQPAEDRREFLEVAGKFSAVLAILGLTSAGLASGASAAGDNAPARRAMERPSGADHADARGAGG